MQRIPRIEEANAEASTAQLLSAVKVKMGGIPNLIATLANSDAALESYLGFSSALQQGNLSAALRERIALAVAGRNQCGYCAAAHAMIGAKCGLSKDDVKDSLNGASNDAHSQAAISLALAIVDERGRVSDDTLQSARDAGLSDNDIVEVLAHTVLSIFTNYLNNLADTEIDFPLIDLPAQSA
jgi:uncharacterized peroxidase-related enzyme